MKAVLLDQAGAIDQLTLRDIEKPTPNKNEILIKAKALSINPVDFKVRGNEDVLTMIYGPERPAIIGWDVAGEVEAVGEEVTAFKVGDRVFGMVNFLGMGKAYAEYVTAPYDQLSAIPQGVSYEDAAATTLAALTALQVLRDKVTHGDRVLIHAGSGGVGHFAIQIAKQLGAWVVSTSSSKNKEFISNLGADHHIDYRAEAFEEVLENIDFVFDMFNGEILHKSVALVKEGGTVISIPSPEFSTETKNLAEEKNVHLAFHMVQSNGADMSQLANMLQNGTLTPYVSHQFPFDKIGDAHAQLESGRTVGKVVVIL